ncbi:MAG: YeeE/YedE thiosulfate transporter family protein [Pseudomonadota bacterium]
MDFLLLALLGAAMGLAFGIALEKGRVFEPGMIVGQMQLRNFTMLKMFLTAMATSLVVLAVLNGVFDVAMHPKAAYYGANVMGGLLMGVGMVLAGACPGTTLAQIGVGYKDAWFTLLGGIAGAVTYGYLEPGVIRPMLLAEGPGKLQLDQMLGVPFWGLALATAAVLVLGLVALERWRPWRQDMGENYEGLSTDLGEAPSSARPARG